MTARAIDTLADFVVEASAIDIPGRVRERAWDCVLDAIGAAAAGYGQKSAYAMRRAFERQGSSEPTSIWFHGASSRIAAAAAANAMAATALDVDDGHRKAAGHPGVAVVVSAIAASEHVSPTRDEFIAAVVLGLEASVRVALARNAEHHASTVSGRWAGIGAAVAAAKLFELDRASVANAILIAEQHAPRVSAAKHHGFSGSDVKEGIAWSVHAGLEAVPLAKEGFTAYPDAFDQGILYRGERLIADLDSFESIDGLFFKPYACCRWTHAAIDGAVSLVREREIEPAAIEKITVRTFEQAVGLSNRPAPRSETEAQFSMPFCIALAIQRGPDELLPIDTRRFNDQSVLRLAERVEIELDAGFASLFPAFAGAAVTIVHSGRSDSIRVDAPVGDPTNPLSRESLAEKFRKLTRHCLRAKRAEDLIRGIYSAEAPPASIVESLRTQLSNCG